MVLCNIVDTVTQYVKLTKIKLLILARQTFHIYTIVLRGAYRPNILTLYRREIRLI